MSINSNGFTTEYEYDINNNVNNIEILSYNGYAYCKNNPVNMYGENENFAIAILAIFVVTVKAILYTAAIVTSTYATVKATDRRRLCIGQASKIKEILMGTWGPKIYENDLSQDIRIE